MLSTVQAPLSVAPALDGAPRPLRGPSWLVLALLGTMLAACAGKNSAPASAPVTGVPMGTGGGSRGVGLEITRRADAVTVSLPVPPAKVFAALEAVYYALEVPLTTRDVAKLSLGNEGFKFRRKIADMPSRRLFDCGGSSGMPNAETYTITASIVSSVTASGSGGSTLFTVVQASAENPNFPGSGVSCSSTGTIEARIEKNLRTQLSQGSE